MKEGEYQIKEYKYPHRGVRKEAELCFLYIPLDLKNENKSRNVFRIFLNMFDKNCQEIKNMFFTYLKDKNIHMDIAKSHENFI